MDGENAPAVMIAHEDGVAAVTLSRPASGNPLLPETVTALTAAFRAVRDDGSARALLLRGEGRHFTTGGDARWFARLLDAPLAGRRAAFADLLADGSAMVEALCAIEVPIVAAAHGVVAGGGLALLLAADLVVADPSATLLFSHRHVGLPPDGGVTWLLPRIVGQRRAAQLILEGASLDAAAAFALGLVSRLAEADKLDQEARRLARAFADGPTEALRDAKRLLRHGAGATLGEQLALETDAILVAIERPEFSEGTCAMLERRAPVFPRSDRGGQ